MQPRKVVVCLMKKQTKEDQEKRPKKLRCPVHGVWLTQVDEDRAECPRKDCNIRFLCGARDIVAEMCASVLRVERVG